MRTPSEQPPVYPRPGTPVEQPTEPLMPVDRAAPAARPDPYAADPRAGAAAFWRLETLRTALTLVGLIAVVAVGLAVWALLRSEHNGQVVTRTPTTKAAMIALSSRVNHLQSRIHALSYGGNPGTGAVRSLEARFTALQQGEKRLATQVGHGASTAQVTQLAGKEAALSAKVSQLTGKEAALSGQVSQLQGRVSQLQGRVSQLTAEVSQLRSQSGTQTGTQTSGTGTSTVP